MMSNFDNQGILIGQVVKIHKMPKGAYVALDSDSRADHHCYHFVKFAKDLADRLVNVQRKQKLLLSVHLETKLAADRQSMHVLTVADQIQLLN